MSLSLLSMLLIGVLTLFPSALTVVTLVDAGRAARLQAQSRIESLAATPFHELRLGDRHEDITLPAAGPVKLRTSVRQVPGFSVERLKSLRCTATWKVRQKEHVHVREMYVHNLRR